MIAERSMNVNDFTVIYRILKALHSAMDCDAFDAEMISAERMKTSENRLNRLLIQLINAGYIEGFKIRKYVDSDIPEIIITPAATITLKGLEYLEENSLMARAAKFLTEAKDFIP